MIGKIRTVGSTSHRLDQALVLADIVPPGLCDFDQLFSLGRNEDGNAGKDCLPLWVKLVDKLCNNTEVRPSTSKGPEQVRVISLVSSEDRPISCNDSDLVLE